MARIPRLVIPNNCYHFLNRGNQRATIFHEERDYRAFLALLREAHDRVPIPILALCLMPNHLHLVVRPACADDLHRWSHFLFTKHANHYHAKYGTSGHVWQGRYKIVAVQHDRHLMILMRYVERNAYRSKLVERPEDWPWGSLGWRLSNDFPVSIAESPIDLPKDWAAFVREPQTATELAEIRASIAKQKPFGDDEWSAKATLMSGRSPKRPGRPKK